MLKLKLQYFGHLIQTADSMEKTLMLGKMEGKKRKGQQRMRWLASPTPRACSDSCPLSRRCHPTISSSVVRFSSCLQSFPASGSFPLSQFFASSGQRIEFQLHHQPFQWMFRVDFLYSGLVCSPCCPRDSQESSPAPQFEGINSLALSLLYGPTLTSIHDYCKNNSFDLCQQCLCFVICCLGLS